MTGDANSDATGDATGEACAGDVPGGDGSPSASGRWDRRYAAADGPDSPASFVVAHAGLLPDRGRALDVAGGTGRHARWLARRGLTVMLVDASGVAVERVRALAATEGWPVEAAQRDLPDEPIPAGPYDVVLVHDFLDRAVWRSLPELLRPAGVLLACQPTVTNLERHARPSRRWLLAPGEILDLAADMAGTTHEVVEAAEGWTSEGRHEGWLVLRAPV